MSNFDQKIAHAQLFKGFELHCFVHVTGNHRTFSRPALSDGCLHVLTLHRWGASQFAATASLTNLLGGRKNARYLKKPVYWQGYLLDNGIAVFDAWLRSCLDAGGDGAAQPVKQVPCINVVIPTFRCNVKRLSRMTELRVSGASACVHILIVIDNPKSPDIKDVQALQSYEPNHLVRVFVQVAFQISKCWLALARDCGNTKLCTPSALRLRMKARAQQGTLAWHRALETGQCCWTMTCCQRCGYWLGACMRALFQRGGMNACAYVQPPWRGAKGVDTGLHACASVQRCLNIMIQPTLSIGYGAAATATLLFRITCWMRTSEPSCVTHERISMSDSSSCRRRRRLCSAR
eukprot:364152-Chlamydomonas_euryale.AAC.9